MTQRTKTTATTEEYLEVIYMMSSEHKTVKGARLAESLRVSRPTVTATLRRMARDGLVKFNSEEGCRANAKGFQSRGRAPAAPSHCRTLADRCARL